MSREYYLDLKETSIEELIVCMMCYILAKSKITVNQIILASREKVILDPLMNNGLMNSCQFMYMYMISLTQNEAVCNLNIWINTSQTKERSINLKDIYFN
jgi:hypothetical protein